MRGKSGKYKSQLYQNWTIQTLDDKIKSYMKQELLDLQDWYKCWHEQHTVWEKKYECFQVIHFQNQSMNMK